MASPFLRAAQAAVKAASAVGATQTATLRRTTSYYNAATGRHSAAPVIAQYAPGATLTAARTGTAAYLWTGSVATFDGFPASADVTDYTWTVVVEEYTEGLVDGTNVKTGDRRVLGASGDLAVTPNPTTDTLILDSLTYQIVPAGPAIGRTLRSDPAGATWTLQVRR